MLFFFLSFFVSYYLLTLYYLVVRYRSKTDANLDEIFFLRYIRLEERILEFC